jgi:hypothetical protein
METPREHPGGVELVEESCGRHNAVGEPLKLSEPEWAAEMRR